LNRTEWVLASVLPLRGGAAHTCQTTTVRWKKRGFGSVLAVWILAQPSLLQAAENPCVNCESPPEQDINACTFPVDGGNRFYLGNTGPGSKYDASNGLHYGFSPKSKGLAPFRSDYSIPDEGSLTNPLNITDCFLFPTEDTFQTKECWSHGAERRWPYGGMYKKNYEGGENYWVLSVNNEDVSSDDETWDDPQKDSFHACNAGPPNLSFIPDRGATKISGADDAFDMTLDLKAFHTTDKQVSCGEYSAPFFGFGAHCKRGNSHPVAYINTDRTKIIPSVLRFRSKITHFAEPAILLTYRLMVIAEWPGLDGMGRTRMLDRLLFLELTNPSDDPGKENPVVSHLHHKDWTWPAINSFFFPGADLAFFDAGRMADLDECSDDVREITELLEGMPEQEYTINLTELFKCAESKGLFRDTIPEHQHIAVKGIHWILEGVGTEGALAVSVRDMDILFNEPQKSPIGSIDDCSTNP